MVDRKREQQVLSELSQATGCSPDLNIRTDRTHSIRLSQQGIGLFFDTESGEIFSVHFHIRGGPIDSGEMRPFVDTPPFGISIDDSRTEIRRKLGKASFTGSDSYPGLELGSGYQYDNYNVVPFEVICVFDWSLHKLSSISVAYLGQVESSQAEIGQL